MSNIYTTQAAYSKACDVTVDTASRRLRDLPHGGGMPRRYHLAAVLPTMKASERRSAVPRLFETATETVGLYAGDDIGDLPEKLESWLDTAQRQRQYICLTSFTAALARSLSSSEIFHYLPQIHRRLLLDADVLRFVVIDGTEPDWASFSTPFALANARAESLPLLSKEAA